MQLVKPSIEHLDVNTNPLKAIEIAGRTCYKSEDKITDDSAEKFVGMLLKRGHHAMLEHSNFILQVSRQVFDCVLAVDSRSYLRLSMDPPNNGCLISGNLRAFMDFLRTPFGASPDVQRGIARCLVMKAPIFFEDMLLDHLSVPGDFDFDVEIFKGNLTVGEKLQHQVMSYKIVCNRGVTHEIVRHRPFSYAQESTRYCNYKGGVTFVIPHWANDVYADTPIGYDDLNRYKFQEGAWIKGRLDDESLYKTMLNSGQTPQDARDNLPISTKTEIVVTGNLQQWRHFFKLRCAKAAHPQMQEVANMVLADMQQRVPGLFDEVL